MCLTRIDNKKKKKLLENCARLGVTHIQAYKVVRLVLSNPIGSQKEFSAWATFKGGLFRVTRNINKSSVDLFDDNNKNYKAGFHCLGSEESCFSSGKAYTLDHYRKKFKSCGYNYGGDKNVKVFIPVTQITCIGSQWDTDCLVTKEFSFRKPRGNIKAMPYQEIMKG